MPVFPPPVDPDDPGRGPTIMGVSWTFTSLAIILIAMRLHVRANVLRSLGADDWFMLAAGVCMPYFPGVVFLHVDPNANRHFRLCSKHV